MDDWVGVATIAVVYGGVGALLVAIGRLTRPEGSTRQAHGLHVRAPHGPTSEDAEAVSERRQDLR